MLQTDNKLKQTELETSVKSINAQLSGLISIADKEMHNAVNEAETAKKSGITMLMVSHDSQALSEPGWRIERMEAGAFA